MGAPQQQLNKLLFHSFGNGVSTIIYPKFVENVSYFSLHSGQTDKKVTGNLTTVHSVRNQLQ